MSTSRARTLLVTGALMAGAAVGAAGIANAASNGSGSNSPPPAGQPPGDPAKLSHGPGETLLTGDAATKARKAAQAAVPGATVIRVETDAQGGAYEAHMVKADGSYVTVELSRSFEVTGTETGFGAGPPPAGTPQG